jgi:hypothetical protein
VVEVEVDDVEVPVVEQVPDHVDHHEHVVAACAGAIGNAKAAAATEARTNFFIIFPPNRKLQNGIHAWCGANANQSMTVKARGVPTLPIARIAAIFTG